MSKPNVREAALDALLKIHKNQAYSNLLLNDVINQKQINKVDVPLFTQIVYGTLQQQKRIDYTLDHYSKKSLSKLEGWVLILLRLSIYQLKYLDRVPDHAVLNEAVTIAKKRGHKGISGMVNGILRSYLRHGEPDLSSVSSREERIAVKTSHPSWMISHWAAQYGWETTELTAEANNLTPGTSLRINTVLTTKEKMMQELKLEGLTVEESPLLEEALRVKKGAAASTKAFQEGKISIQDEGSMLAVKVLDPGLGEKILDACAAPGGKTAYAAELMNNTGEVVSIDLHEHKVRLIKNQSARLGLTNVRAEMDDARKLEKEAPESFDKILVDAPCSGLGVIRRKPDMKWTKKEEDLARLVMIQKEILNNVWHLLKPEGRLVYSTCTIEKNENEHQIERFLTEHSDASPDNSMKNRLPEQVQNVQEEAHCVQLLPGKFGTDGFFIASLQKLSGPEK